MVADTNSSTLGSGCSGDSVDSSSAVHDGGDNDPAISPSSAEGGERSGEAIIGDRNTKLSLWNIVGCDSVPCEDGVICGGLANDEKSSFTILTGR